LSYNRLVWAARRRRPDGKWRRQKAGSKAYAFAGWSAFALGNIMRFIAMRFAAQTVLSGLGSLQFVIIPVASRFMLGIRASASTVLGVSVVLLGALPPPPAPPHALAAAGPRAAGWESGRARERSATACSVGQQAGQQAAMPASSVFRGMHAADSARPCPPFSSPGNALIILYGPAEVTFTLAQLRRQWATPAMTTFLLVLGGLLCLLQWLHWRVMGGGTALQPQPQLVATLEGGKAGAAGGGDRGSGGEGAASDSQHLLAAGSGKWVGLGGWGPGLPPRDHDAVTVFAGALLFSAVASFVGAWSVLFSKSLTYVVSYMPASLTDW
jgi:hypothetical protein